MNARAIGLCFLLVVACVCRTAIPGDLQRTAAAEQPAPDIQAIATACSWGGARPYNLVDGDCFGQLTRYFSDKPVWAMASMYYYIVRVNLYYSAPAVNRRLLEFSESDWRHMDDYPTWGSVFDGNIHRRVTVVQRVFADEVCRGLADRGAIQPDAGERCAARELFKYAAYLDACLTGFERNLMLVYSRDTSPKTVYEENLEEIERRGGTGEVDRRRLTEFALHSSWIAQTCMELPAIEFDYDLRPVRMRKLGEAGLDVRSFALLLRDSHDAALGIAARAGDPWAIQGYYPPHPLRDPEYWDSLKERNPLLVHRWLATDVGGTVLNEEEQARHALQAYSMELESAPLLQLKDYLEEFLIPAETVNKMLGRARGDEAKTQAPSDVAEIAGADGKLVAPIVDDGLLKYPWPTPTRKLAAEEASGASEFGVPDLQQISTDCRYDEGFSHELESGCLAELTAHFSEQPVWRMMAAPERFFDDDKDGGGGGGSINSRASYLKYTRADWGQRDAPTWADIFDGKHGEREEAVVRVFADGACNALAGVAGTRGGGVAPSLAARCQARELFKFATHHDACLTGLARTGRMLNSRAGTNTVMYQWKLREIRRRHGRPAAGTAIELNMYTAWVTRMCRAVPAPAFDDDLRVLAGELVSSHTVEEMAALMKTGHDAAMAIAARAGDAWAIRSHLPPPPSQDPEYWAYLQATHPLLLHRWSATSLVADVLSEEERIWHAVQAYAMERKTYPDLAMGNYLKQFSIRSSALREAWTRDGGRAKPPADEPEMSLGELAVAGLGEGALLKYPWQAKR